MRMSLDGLLRCALCAGAALVRVHRGRSSGKKCTSHKEKELDSQLINADWVALAFRRVSFEEDLPFDPQVTVLTPV